MLEFGTYSDAESEVDVLPVPGEVVVAVDDLAVVADLVDVGVVDGGRVVGRVVVLLLVVRVVRLLVVVHRLRLRLIVMMVVIWCQTERMYYQ